VGCEGEIASDVFPAADAAAQSRLGSREKRIDAMPAGGDHTFRDVSGFGEGLVKAVPLHGVVQELADLGQSGGIYGDIPSGVLTPPSPDGFALHAPVRGYVFSRIREIS
jgi:hypothetical protein